MLLNILPLKIKHYVIKCLIQKWHRIQCVKLASFHGSTWVVPPINRTVAIDLYACMGTVRWRLRYFFKIILDMSLPNNKPGDVMSTNAATNQPRSRFEFCLWGFHMDFLITKNSMLSSYKVYPSPHKIKQKTGKSALIPPPPPNLNCLHTYFTPWIASVE